MKRWVTLMLVLVLLVNFVASSLLTDGGMFKLSVSAAGSERPVVVDLTNRDDFGWGINVHHYGFQSYPEIYLEDQIHLVAKSGSKWIRMNGSLCSSPEEWSYFDTAVGLANAYGLKIIMTVEPDRKLGLDYITLAMETIASRYNGEDGRGFVDVFQPWNETDITLMSAKYGSGGASGEAPEDYYTISVDGVADLPEYLEYFKAAKQGLVNAGNKSKMMVNFAATHWGCAKYYLDNGLEIDYLGMDLYTVNPYDLELSAKTIRGACERLYDSVIKEYDIPVIIAETNLHMGYVNQVDRENPTLATYDALFDMMYIYYDQPWIKGLILYELLDEPSNGATNQEAWFGLIECSENGEIGEPKQIYNEFQRLIKGDINLPKILRGSIDFAPYEKLVVGTADDSDMKNDNELLGDDTFYNEEPKLDDIVLNNSDDEVETKIEEVIAENITNPVKTITTKEKTTKVPWGLGIAIGSGMLIIPAAYIIIFVLIKKKRLGK